MKKSIILGFAFLLTCMVACVDHALEPTPMGGTAWREGGPLSDAANSIATDKVGNVYITGAYEGEVKFGSVTLSGAGGSDLYIAKYNRMGVVQWAISAGTFRPEWGQEIDVDAQGNVYVTGTFNEKINFGPIFLSAPIAQSGGLNYGEAFVTKYNTNGEVQWAKRAGGTGADTGNSIAVDGNGNVFVTGTFQGTATFGNFTLTTTNGNCMFIVKYNSNGDVLWAKKAEGSLNAEGHGIATDGNANVYVTGNFASVVTIDGQSLTSSGDSDVLLAKLDNDGVLQWMRKAGGAEGDFSSGIAVDEGGNVSITGIFRSNATFEGITLINNGVFDIFVASYTTAGVIQWAKGIGGKEYDFAGDIVAGKDGSVYLAGAFRESVTVGTQTFKTKEIGNFVTNTATDLILIKFRKDGTLLWAKQEGDGGLNTEIVSGVTYGSMNELYITGHFYSNTTLAGTNLTSAGQNDIFVAQYKE